MGLPRRSSIVLAATLQVAGCAGEAAPARAVPAPQRSAAAPLASAAATAASSTPPPAAPARPLDPTTVALPAPVACSFDERDLAIDVELALGPGDKPWAKLAATASSVRATLGVAPSEPGWAADFEVAAVSLRGFVAPKRLPLRLRGATLFGEIYAPNERIDLRIVSAEADAVTTEAPAPEGLAIPARELRGRASCKSLGLTGKAFEPLEAIYTTRGEAAYLRGASVPFARSDSGPFVGKLEPMKAGTAAVERVGSARGRVRVLWQLTEGWVIGWVPQSAVTSSPGEAGSAGGLGLSGIGQGGRPEMLVCPHDVALRVRQGDRTEVVGVAQKGAQLLPVRARSDERFPVTLPDDALTLENGAELFVRAADVGDCSLR